MEAAHTASVADEDLESLHLITQANRMPAGLRPLIGPTENHRLAARVYMEAMEAAEHPAVRPWEELQLETLLETAEHILQTETGAGPFEVWAVTGTKPGPRDTIILHGWLALLNRGHVAYLQDTSDGSLHTARLVIFRH